MLQHLTSRWPSDACLQVSYKTSVIFIRKADPTTLMPHSLVQVIEISVQTVWCSRPLPNQTASPITAHPQQNISWNAVEIRAL